MVYRRLGLRMDETVARRTARATRLKETTTETAEPIETEKEQAEQIWCKRSTDKVTRDAELRTDLKRVFNAKGMTMVTEQHRDVVKVIGDFASGNTIMVPSYPVFGRFMANTGQARGGLKKAFCTALDMFVDKVSAAAAAPNDDTYMDVGFDLDDPKTTGEV
jgi:hypothetical protein